MPPPISAAEIADEALVEGSSLWKDAWSRLRKNRLAVGSLFTFIFIVLFCIVGPWISPWEANTQDLFLGATGPSAQHWFGTDTLGRDLMVRVMYGGRIIETGPAREIYARPRHPYTIGLMASVPRLDQATGTRLVPIDGQPPNLANLPPGCAFAPRCRNAVDRCRVERPALVKSGPEHLSACHFHDQLSA